MSLFKEEHLECPFCHQDVPFILHNSINVGIHPEHKAKVLDNTLFQYQCPHCKKSDMVCYPTLYHDPEKGIMIQVLWSAEEFGQSVTQEEQELITKMGTDNYRRREVLGYRELIEKIRIYDAGLDEFAIALIKTLYVMRYADIQLCFYDKTDDGILFIKYGEGDQFPEDLIFENDIYETALQYTQEWQKPHQPYEYLRVDEAYFYEDVINTLEKENSEK